MNEINKEDVQNQPRRDYLLSASVFISALLISISLVYSAGKKGDVNELAGNLGGNLPNPTSLEIRPISSEDHYLGKLNAPVKIVEYSDLECPFCKRFHTTLKQVLVEYGDKVVWVYRHFPLDALHSKARKEAEATECANELGGNVKFWAYTDKLYEITPSNNGLDLSLLPKIASDIGLNQSEFSKCLDSGKYADRVANDLDDATNAGGLGTPYSLVIGKDGKKYPINGALPYEQVKLVVDQALR